MKTLDRISWLLLLAVGIWAVLFFRTFQIQVLQGEKYRAVASNQSQDQVLWKAERGKILDRRGTVLADNVQDMVNGYAETRRLFPQGALASQIIGQVGRDGQGLMGLEYFHDEELRGIPGWRQRVRDVKRRIIPGMDRDGVRPVPGKNLVLTLDSEMQGIVENALKNGVETYRALSGSAVILDPHTGEILAMASYPTYDPNQNSSGRQRANRNDLVSLSFEPGSIFKIITASAALNENAVNLNEVFAGESGRWTLPNGDVIRDTKDHGDMNITEAMTYSSNIVFAKIADKIGAEVFYRYARNFGFGSKSFVELPGEESGLLKEVHSWSGRTLKTMGFGHEIMANPLQMVMSFAAVANGGKLMQPTIIKEWRDSDGNVLKSKEPVEVRRVISEETAASVREMLRKVVVDGTGKSVISKKLPHVDFGGKTGTAEKYDTKLKRYDRSRQIASFIGLVPASDPRYVCMVLIDEPTEKATVGGLTAGPVFRKIMEDIYYHPALSPLPYNMAQVSLQENCKTDFIGLSKTAAERLALSENCGVRFEGTGSQVIAQKKDFFGDSGLILTIGHVENQQMPDLKGLALKDALELMKNSRVNVSFSGKGRVTEQFPDPDTPLTKGMNCRLVLKEQV
ncbi:MAG: transpeptidase family protein [Fibrobacter sp.]|jgi:cell division protein FtsI/penicillin-binding protein 2|nr:transpeptidase family protein [Fibrobacter sp.]